MARRRPTRPHPRTQAPRAEIVAAGESACLVRLGNARGGEARAEDARDPQDTLRVHALLAALDTEPPLGVRDLVPAYASLLVRFDPLVASRETVTAAIEHALEQVAREEWSGAGAARSEGRLVEIPVRYGGEAGPDLEAVAELLGLSPDEVVWRHAGASYTVAFLGFLAGFPYLAGLPPELAVPRLATPRTRVPAGSVAIASAQTGIYPVASPAGWRIIGQTQRPLFDPTADPPTLLRPGDRVRFREMKPQRPQRSQRGTQRSRRETQRTQRSAEDAKESQSLTTEITEITETTEIAQSEEPAQNTSATSASSSATSAFKSSLPWLRVVRAGPLTTVQDLGREGYARYGVSPSGAADADALQLGNLLLGNPPWAAGLEVTLGGASFVALGPCAVALTGADCPAEIDGRALPAGAVATLEPGQTLMLGLARTGLRAYLCVAGGIAVVPLLGSRSTDLRAGFGGLDGRALRAGDELARGEPELDDARRPMSHRRLPPDPARRAPADGWHRLRVLPGPHALSAPDALSALVAGEYEVDPRSDRMGVRLRRRGAAGAERPRGGQIVSEGIPRGAIQVPPDGEPILLLAEHQTTGGYLIPAVVIAADRYRVGQLRPGERLRLDLVSEAEALEALRAREAWLARVGSGPVTVGRGEHASADPALLAGGFTEWDEATDATMADDREA